MNPYKIAIVGGGIGGLATALFTARAGHDVTLCEAAPEPAPMGAGLLLQPTGLAVLDKLGLRQDIINAGARIHKLEGHAHTGRLVLDVRYSRLRDDLFGVGIHRGVLFNALYEKVKESSIKIRTDFNVVNYEHDSKSGQVRILTCDKQHGEGGLDVVVDASGQNSVLRRKYAPHARQTDFDYGALWGVVKMPDNGFSPDALAQRYKAARKMCGILPLNTGPHGTNKHAAFFWSMRNDEVPYWRKSNFSAWKNEVTNLWPAMQSLTNQFNSAADLTHAKYSEIRMKRYHHDRMVFIGDAAHCTSPQLGQGANMALVDAMILNHCLNTIGNPDAALATYTKTRKGHTSFYQTASRWLTPFFQSDNLLVGDARDVALGTLCGLPYFRTEMAKTLCGVKTGLFTTMNPGTWHERFNVETAQHEAEFVPH